MHDFTENYIKVKMPFDESLVKPLRDVKLETIGRDGIIKVSLLKIPEYVQ